MAGRLEFNSASSRRLCRAYCTQLLPLLSQSWT